MYMQIRVIDRIYEDLCYKSIEALEARVKDFLSNNYGIKKPWIVDSIEGSRNYEQPEEFVDIVFFGSFLQRFFESGNWVSHSVRFWVLCNSVKRVLVEDIGIPDEAINVIPRYALYPKADNIAVFPRKNEEISFVYAGRISESKNIEALVYITYYLQKNFAMKIKLYLIGNADNVSSIYSLKEDQFNFEKRLFELMGNLDWLIQPEVISEVEQGEWRKMKFANKLYVSFSTYNCEDYGVSVAEAQEHGWPCLLSNWGGYKEVEGSHVLKVPSSYLIESSGEQIALKYRCRYAASWIYKNWENRSIIKDDKAKVKNNEVYLPIKKIDKIRKKFIEKYGTPTLYLARGQANKFYADKNGRKFFESFQAKFGSGEKTSPKIFIIINDMSEKISYAKDAVEKIMNDNTAMEDVEFIKLNELMWKNNIIKFKFAEKIIFCFWNRSLVSTVRFLETCLPSTVNICIYSNEKQENDLSPRIKWRWIES